MKAHKRNVVFVKIAGYLIVEAFLQCTSQVITFLFVEQLKDESRYLKDVY